MKWPKACLGDVAQVVSGATPKSSVSHYWDGDIPWITPADLSNLARKEVSATSRRITAAGLSSCSASLLPARSVLFSSRAPIGHVAINAVPMATNQGFKSFVPDHKILSPDFLYWWLKSNKSYLQSLGRGATFKEVSKEIVESIEIPLPPLEEQRRIAAILDKAADLHSLSKRADQLAIDLRVSRLRQLLNSEVSHRSKSQYVPLSDLIRGKPNNGIFRKNPEYQDPDKGGLPVVWVEQLFRGEVLELSACKKLDATNAEIAKYGLTNGDILFCRSSLKPEGIAKPNIYMGADGQAIFECHLIRISPDPAKINPIFLNECLNLPEIRAEARRLSKTSTMTTIDQDGILAIAVPLPPLHIQEQFAQDFALFQYLSTRRRKSNHAIGLLTASLASIQLGKT